MTAVREHFREHPEKAVGLDAAARARLVEGLRVDVEGPHGWSVATDMSKSIGGTASAPSPGWLLRSSDRLVRRGPDRHPGGRGGRSADAARDGGDVRIRRPWHPRRRRRHARPFESCSRCDSSRTAANPTATSKVWWPAHFDAHRCPRRWAVSFPWRSASRLAARPRGTLTTRQRRFLRPEPAYAVSSSGVRMSRPRCWARAARTCSGCQRRARDPRVTLAPTARHPGRYNWRVRTNER